MSRINEKQCPICNQINHCQQAMDKDSDEKCWCIDAHFPAQVMEKVPEHLVNRACICQNCLSRLSLATEV